MSEARASIDESTLPGSTASDQALLKTGGDAGRALAVIRSARDEYPESRTSELVTQAQIAQWLKEHEAPATP